MPVDLVHDELAAIAARAGAELPALARRPEMRACVLQSDQRDDDALAAHGSGFVQQLCRQHARRRVEASKHVEYVVAG